MNEIKLGILGSGKGSNFGAILDAIRSGWLRCEVALVLSDVAGSGILVRAERAGLPTHAIYPGPSRSRLAPAAECEMVERLRGAGVNLVVLAGFMRILGRALLDAYPGRIINVHPSLLPKFPGLEAWRQALDAGERVTGCTVHLVDAGIDTGEILARREVEILPGDTPDLLHARIQKAEHELLPDVIDRFIRSAAGGGR